MSIDQKRLIERQLWNIADTLRGKMDADDFRGYILGFIFYKYLSEKIQLFADNILQESGEEISFDLIDETTAEGKQYVDVIEKEALESLGYFLKPSHLFKFLAKKGKALDVEDDAENVRLEQVEDSFILDDLQLVLNSIERSTAGTESEQDFNQLFEDLDLTSSKLGRTVKDKNVLIAKVLNHLNKIDFDLQNSESDILGDAYEYLIGKFASGAGKKAGEFYTPQEVSKVLAAIVTSGKSKLKSVYDPTCGSGSLLLRVAKEVKVSDFYGQEMNRTTFNLARMNMIMHDVRYDHFDIRLEDTLKSPQHEGMRFEAIVANPPFSAKWSANSLFLNDDRFSQYGRLGFNS